MELSVAYVDKIPTCGGLAAIVCKGTLARRKSLDQLDPIESRGARPRTGRCSTVAGMNHLHWPRALRHSDDAVADSLAALSSSEAAPRQPHHERTYVLLGDAHAKNQSDRCTARSGARRLGHDVSRTPRRWCDAAGAR